VLKVFDEMSQRENSKISKTLCNRKMELLCNRKSTDYRKKKKQRKERKPWKDQFDSIEEEGLLNDDDGRHGLTRRCYLLAFVVGFFVLFSFFSLILWGASRPQKPIITMKVRTDIFHFHLQSEY
jgi:hypothetical protein